MSMLRALSALGAVAGGIVQGDRLAKRDKREQEDQDFQNEQRARMRQQYAREDQLRSDLAAAAQPATVTNTTPAAEPIGVRDVAPPAPTPQFSVGGQTFADQASADKAAAAMNTPDAQTGRMAAAYAKAGDPLTAMKLRSEGLQQQSAKLNLDEAQRKHVNQLFDDSLNALTSHDDIANLISRSGIGGAAQVKAIPTADGKQVEYVKVNPDGSMVKTGQVFDNSAKGLMMAKEALAKAVPLSQKLTTLHQQALEAETSRHNQATEKVAAQNAATMEGYRTDQAENMRQQRRLQEMEINGRMKAAAGGQPPGPVWDDKADAFLRSRYTVTDPVSGQTSVDGNGLQFAKAVALAQARRNGGDTTSGLGFAFDVDSQLKAASGNDPVKLRVLRAQYVQALYGGPPAAPAKPAPPVAGVTAEQPSVMGFLGDAASRMGNALTGSGTPSAAPSVADPLAARAAQESSELNRGTRLDFSPEVKAYFEAKKRAEDEQNAAGNAAYAAGERARAAALAKQFGIGVPR